MHGQEHAVCGCRGSGMFIVSVPQTACGARLHGFDRYLRDRGSPAVLAGLSKAETLFYVVQIRKDFCMVGKNSDGMLFMRRA